ncbi:hypothetical protein [endosymbiont GvMRE of Glomus versiforme]|uniref:hypothetical protein n=1 Tax=endosymbiont GvMRE of Glomus versiforme TaxID=2039283 RepID=UPI000EDC8E0A|nr:hypothetical protein [endosymbiont GvMRE of Glomus versiforme]RHZ36017.1 hypothetical protein GvMRE_Ic3g75 [endosymbiont GvMRE of Glomus versiforme]
MDNDKLLKNVNLCYLPLAKLQEWLKENNLWEKNFTETKKQWKQELKSNFSSFFIDAELLIIEKDIILLQVADENVREYLTKTYQIQEQTICQKLFGENKHLILLTEQQWQETKEKVKEKQENCFVLLKDEESIKSNLTKWLEKNN